MAQRKIHKLSMLEISAEMIDMFNKKQSELVSHKELAQRVFDSFDSKEAFDNAPTELIIEMFSDHSVNECKDLYTNHGFQIHELTVVAQETGQDKSSIALMMPKPDPVKIAIPAGETECQHCVFVLQLSETFGIDFSLNVGTESIFDVGLTEYYTRTVLQSDKFVDDKTLSQLHEVSALFERVAQRQNDEQLKRYAERFKAFLQVSQL